ncbi:MAG TPA: hypothetical protein VFE61_12550 [Candidatus Sulfotelmatobacter sp.]|jgi:hypothetical protein|nr:hypothetical protein [Candidatus Sulfotelmatobacter sp.]
MKEVQGNPASRFDALANKTIVYWTTDAVVTIAYTGAAYIGNQPTDDWIVQKLTGVDVSEKFGMRGFSSSRSLDIGQSLKILLQELTSSEVANNPLNFELTAVGWHWKMTKHPMEGRYQPVPMAWGLNKPQNGKFDTQVERLARYWYFKHRTFFHASPNSNWSKAERDKMFDALRSEEPSQTADELAAKVERATVDAVRSVSTSNPYVGPNCMSVLLAPPHQRALIRISFFPQEEHKAELVSKTAPPVVLPAAFSPWIVGRGWMEKPSVRVGQALSETVGPFTIEFGGPALPCHVKGLIFAQSSQTRPKKPLK